MIPVKTNTLSLNTYNTLLCFQLGSLVRFFLVFFSILFFSGFYVVKESTGLW